MPYNYPGFTLAHPFPEPRPKEKYGYHGGADYAAKEGTPVPAMFGGTVFRSGYIHGYGMAVVIESKTAQGSIYTLYGHLGPNGLPKATNEDGTPTVIKPGQAIGEVASRAFNETFNLHYNPHLHLEIINGSAKPNRTGSFGLMSSDLTHRANPETFDINDPKFPYEITGRPPKPGQTPINGPSQPSVAQPVPKAGNPPARVPMQLSPGMPIPGAGGPSSIGSPNGPTPLAPPGGWRAPVGPRSPAPTVPPLNFAREAPRNVGPFAVPPQLMSPRWPTPSLPTPIQNGGPNVDNRAPSGPVVSASPQASPTFDDRFGDWTASSQGAATPGSDQPAPDASGKKPMRYLGRRIIGASGASAFDTGALAVPFVVTDNPLAPAPPTSFNDRFGNLGSSSPVPQLPAQGPQSGGSTQDDPKNIRVLSSRFPALNPGGVALGSPPSPGAPNPSPAQNGWPPATQPLPDFPVPPMVYGLPDPTSNSMDDWFDRWIKPLFERGSVSPSSRAGQSLSPPQILSRALSYRQGPVTQPVCKLDSQPADQT